MKPNLYIIIILLLFTVSCGGGGSLNLGSGGDDEAEVDLSSQELPGTNVVELSAASFDAVLAVGSGIAIVDTFSSSGRYQLKSTLVFSQ